MLPQVTHFKVKRDWQSHIPCNCAPPSCLQGCSLAGPGDRTSGVHSMAMPHGKGAPTALPCHNIKARPTPELLSVPSPPPKPSGGLTGAGCLQTRYPDLVPHPQIHTKPWNRNAFPSIEISAPAETTAVRWHGAIPPRQSSH